MRIWGNAWSSKVFRLIGRADLSISVVVALRLWPLTRASSRRGMRPFCAGNAVFKRCVQQWDSLPKHDEKQVNRDSISFHEALLGFAVSSMGTLTRYNPPATGCYGMSATCTTLATAGLEVCIVAIMLTET